MGTANLPKVDEMEKELLSAMMLKDGLIIPSISAVLKAEDFYDEKHREMYEVIKEVYSDTGTSNILLVADELKKKGMLEKIGLEKFKEIVGATFTTAYAAIFASKIKEKAGLRRMAEVGDIMKKDASSDKKPLEEILKEAERMMMEVKNETAPPNISCFSEYFTEKFQKNIEKMTEYGERKTGYENVDKEQIFSPGLYVLGGLPALGKTTFAWQMLEQLAKSGEKCIYCSYEMSEFELFTKSVSREVYRRESANYIREIIKPLMSPYRKNGHKNRIEKRV